MHDRYSPTGRRLATLILALIISATSSSALELVDNVLFRRDNTSYEDVVCQPKTSSPTDTVPPCVEIQAIQEACLPNGTSPLALDAHAQCMCHGSFFTEWPFCLQCLYIHGLRSERDTEFYKSVIASASTELCAQPTPTADFQDIFSKVQATLAQPTTGSTVSSDQFPSQTAVSLYYTASGSLGPGSITGSATGATATGGSTTAGGTTSTLRGGSTGASPTTSGSSQTPGNSAGSSSTSHSASASGNAAAGRSPAGQDGVLVGVMIGLLAWVA